MSRYTALGAATLLRMQSEVLLVAVASVGNKLPIFSPKNSIWPRPGRRQRFGNYQRCC